MTDPAGIPALQDAIDSPIAAVRGIAALAGSIVALPMLAVPLAILTWIVIPFEERRLRELFGQTYADYCARVGRWV